MARRLQGHPAQLLTVHELAKELSTTPPAPDEITVVMDINKTEEAIRRAMLVGALAFVGATEFLRLGEGQDWALQAGMLNGKSGWRARLLWDLVTEDEAGWMLCGIDQETPNSWGPQLEEARESLARWLQAEDLRHIRKASASDGDRIYRSARLIRPVALVEWARKAGIYPEFVRAADEVLGTKPDNKGVLFPERAKFLQQKMKPGFPTTHSLQVQSGVDKKTINKILQGAPVRDHVLDRLALALKISARDFPSA